MTDTPLAARVRGLLPVAPRDYLILFALGGGPLHGHGLLKALETDGGVLFDPANLYRSLRKMERDDLVAESTADAAPTGGAPRRVYRLTRLGRAVLAAEADRLARLTDAARARRLVPATRATR